MACSSLKTPRKFDLPDPLAPMSTLIGRIARFSTEPMLLKPLMVMALNAVMESSQRLESDRPTDRSVTNH